MFFSEFLEKKSDFWQKNQNSNNIFIVALILFHRLLANFKEEKNVKCKQQLGITQIHELPLILPVLA